MAPLSQDREGTPTAEPAGNGQIVSGRSRGRRRAVFMAASGHLSGRLRAVSRGRRHTATADWRSYRVDRLHPGRPAGPRFPPREVSEGDVVTYLSHQLSARAWPHRATVTLHRSAAELADRIWPGMGVLEAIDDASCLLHIGADSPWALSWMITSIDTDFTITDPPELVEQIEILAHRCAAAILT